VHNLFHKTSCAPNLCIRKIVKRSKLEKKQKERKPPRGGAGGRRGARSLQACYDDGMPYWFCAFPRARIRTEADLWIAADAPKLGSLPASNPHEGALHAHVP
jgi:hypothetical protein